jgi:hypothetical protein
MSQSQSYSSPANFNFDLSRDAILVKLTVRQYTGRKKDEILSIESAAANNADSKVIDSYLATMGKDDRMPIQKLGTAARQHLNFHSAMWDEGRRVVANTGYEKLRTELEAMGMAFNAAVEELVGRHDELERKARTSLGPILFDRCGFPTMQTLRDAYGFEIITEPITNPGDIRLRHVSADVVRGIEENTRRVHSGKVGDSLKQLVVRLHEVVDRVATTCATEDAVFRDTMLTNVRALCDVVPSLNLTQDPFISRMTDDIASLIGTVEPKVLRENPAVRKEVADKAKSLAERLRTFTPSNEV